MSIEFPDAAQLVYPAIVSGVFGLYYELVDVMMGVGGVKMKDPSKFAKPWALDPSQQSAAYGRANRAQLVRPLRLHAHVACMLQREW